MKKGMKLFLLMALLLPMMPLGAQQMKRVTGHILDKTPGNFHTGDRRTHFQGGYETGGS